MQQLLLVDDNGLSSQQNLSIAAMPKIQIADVGDLTDHIQSEMTYRSLSSNIRKIHCKTSKPNTKEEQIYASQNKLSTLI